MRRELLLFSSPTPLGQELSSMIHKVAEAHAYNVSEMSTTEIAFQMLGSLVVPVVIVDASIENAGALGPSCFSCRGHFDHELIVSRTYLPDNFKPTRKGGAPPYPYPHVLHSGEVLPGFEGFTWNNDNIISWIEIQFQDESLGTGPRLSLEEAKELADADHETFYRKYLDITRKIILSRKNIRNKKKRIFLSYRGHDFPRISHLAEQLRQSHGVEIMLFEPGRLALEGELLSEGRRWMLYQEIRKAISKCSEMWVLDTEDYLASWWTLGELVAAHHINYYKGGEDSFMEVFEVDHQSWLPGTETPSQADLQKAPRRKRFRILTVTLDGELRSVPDKLDMTITDIDDGMMKESNKILREMKENDNILNTFLNYLFGIPVILYIIFYIIRLFDKKISKLLAQCLPVGFSAIGLNLKVPESNLSSMFEASLNEGTSWKNVKKQAKEFRQRNKLRRFWDLPTVEPERLTGEDFIYPKDPEFFFSAPQLRNVPLTRRQKLPTRGTAKVKFRGVPRRVPVSRLPPRYLQTKVHSFPKHGSRYGLRRIETWVVSRKGS